MGYSEITFEHLNRHCYDSIRTHLDILKSYDHKEHPDEVKTAFKLIKDVIINHHEKQLKKAIKDNDEDKFDLSWIEKFRLMF